MHSRLPTIRQGCRKTEKRRMDALRHLRENKGTEFGYASECVYNALNEAVEIVKGGGVNEMEE